MSPSDLDICLWPVSMRFLRSLSYQLTCLGFCSDLARHVKSGLVKTILISPLFSVTLGGCQPKHGPGPVLSVSLVAIWSLGLTQPSSGECKATFFSISASSLVSKWVGDSEKHMRALFSLEPWTRFLPVRFCSEAGLCTIRVSWFGQHSWPSTPNKSERLTLLPGPLGRVFASTALSWPGNICLVLKPGQSWKPVRGPPNGKLHMSPPNQKPPILAAKTQARKLQPSVIFMDEVDSMLTSRGGPGFDHVGLSV